METKRGPYKMVGFGGLEGWFLKEEVTAKQAQRDAESLDLAEYLLLPIGHNTRHQARKKRPEGTRKSGPEPYMKTTCRGLVFRCFSTTHGSTSRTRKSWRPGNKRKWRWIMNGRVCALLDLELRKLSFLDDTANGG
jgi:hypothetical protein